MDYDFSTLANVVTFAKEIVAQDGAKFVNLNKAQLLGLCKGIVALYELSNAQTAKVNIPDESDADEDIIPSVDEPFPETKPLKPLKPLTNEVAPIADEKPDEPSAVAEQGGKPQAEPPRLVPCRRRDLPKYSEMDAQDIYEEFKAWMAENPHGRGIFDYDTNTKCPAAAFALWLMEYEVAE